jgi:uncharacterized protein YegP (UPF0339 family)
MHHLHLKAPDCEIVVAIEAYATKANAHKGIDAINKHAADAKVEDLTGGRTIRIRRVASRQHVHPAARHRANWMGGSMSGYGLPPKPFCCCRHGRAPSR